MKSTVGFYCHFLGNSIGTKQVVLKLLEKGYRIQGVVTKSFDLAQWLNDQGLRAVADTAQLSGTEYIFCMLVIDNVNAEDIKISNDKLLLLSDYRKLIFYWNDTLRDNFLDRTIIELIESQSQKTPNNIAVITTQTSWTYEALQDRANQFACYLKKYVTKPNQMIALCADRGINMICAILGIMKIGAGYIPLTPEYPKERLMFILNDAQPAHLLVDAQYVGLLSDCKINTTTFDELERTFSTREECALQSGVAPNTPAYMMYTSGSTGTPKGAVVRQDAVANHMLWMLECFQFDETDVFLQKTPFSFDASVWELLMPLVAGAKLVFASQYAHQDPYEMIQEIQCHQVTVLQLVPPMLRELLGSDEVSQCHSLKQIFVGGESLTTGSKKRFFQLFPDKKLHNLYGLTEATIDTTWFTHDSNNYDKDNNIIGEPISNTKVYVFDKDKVLCPIGKPGELHISGAGLSAGYHNRPDLTKKMFLEASFSEIDTKLYCSGDLVSWLPDGKLKYICRVDEQVKIHGCRVETGEIETYIKEHNGVKDVIVLISHVNDFPHLIAYLLIKPSHFFVEASLRDFLTKKLPHFMLPSWYVCVDKFPKLPSGKIDRRTLLKTQKDHAISERKDIELPRDNEECLLVTLWKNILNNEQISINDNFFDLGGSSLSALKILTQIRKYYDVHIGIGDFLEKPTIADLAVAIRQAEHNSHTEMQYNNHVFSLPVITLRQSEDKNKTPLFLIHPIGGTVFWLASLAKCLNYDISVYAIQTPELELGTALFSSVEETADCYIQCIKKIQPNGPYRLGGASFGANVAVEMARQLHSEQQKVEFLLAFDGWAQYPSALYDFEYFKETMQRQYDVFKKKFRMQSLYSADNLFALQYERLLVLNKYQNIMIKAPLFLFKSQELLPEYEKKDEPYNGWEPYSEYGITTIAVPGTHETMFYKPNIQVLAGELARVLQEHCVEQALADV